MKRGYLNKIQIYETANACVFAFTHKNHPLTPPPPPPTLKRAARALYLLSVLTVAYKPIKCTQ